MSLHAQRLCPLLPAPQLVLHPVAVRRGILRKAREVRAHAPHRLPHVTLTLTLTFGMTVVLDVCIVRQLRRGQESEAGREQDDGCNHFA